MTANELALLIEALAIAASRHESQARKVAGYFAAMHDEKAVAMRQLRRQLQQQLLRVKEHA